MKKIISTLALLTIVSGSAFAADLSQCGGHYLLSVSADKKAAVTATLVDASNKGLISVKAHGSSIFNVDATGMAPDQVLILVTKIKSSGAIVECNSQLSF